MSGARISLWPALITGRVHPNVYGHFAEQGGRSVYEGIWVGPNARIPNERGVRLDVLTALRHLHAPVMHWPGGAFADDYHWRGGIGPLNQRPTTINLWSQETEPNEFGTDEFMRFCAQAGCDPCLCSNIGNGTPQEARDWLEYCNFGGVSALSRLRATHGSPEPYHVKYWAVGSTEHWAGGCLSAEEYAREYMRTAGYLHALDGNLALTARGAHFGDYNNTRMNAWNHDFCQAMPHPDLIDSLSLCRYFRRGKGAAFTDSEFLALFGDLLALDRDLQLTDAVLRYYYPDKPVGITLAGWGMWHPEALPGNGLEQARTLRDALLAAAVLHGLQRWPQRVVMANLAQTANALHCLTVTDGGKMLLTPTYHVFDMLRGHMGAQTIVHEVDGPSFEIQPIGCSGTRTVPLLSISATLMNKRLLLTVVNQSLHEDFEAEIRLHGAKTGAVSARLLHSASPRDQNTFQNPKNVVPRRVKADPGPEGLTHVFPPHSLTALTITLE